jgi:omega-6 fatty acid desaturase (delta-12 desaturase)
MRGTSVNGVNMRTDTQVSPYPSRKLIHAEMMKFVKPSTAHGLAIFAVDIGMWAAAIAGVLFLTPLWAKILCSIVAGLKVANLSTLAHDMSHGSFVRQPALNRFLAVVAFLPGLFNCRLWIYDHHVLHHQRVNGKHRDAMTPFSKGEFDALPAYRRRLERIYRAPFGLGFFVHEIRERWLGVMFVPRADMPERARAEAWSNFIILAVYLTVFLALLAAAPLYSGTGSITAIILGLIVPQLIWMELAGFTGYIQHTHPRIAWSDIPAEQARVEAQETVSTHIDFPGWLKFLLHHVYDHAVHHVQPRIPCYRLGAAQVRLNELLGPVAVSNPFSIAWFSDTLRRCKLYDFENHRWLDFDGRPTTQSIDVESIRHSPDPGTLSA